jgi:hypothetical protein
MSIGVGKLFRSKSLLILGFLWLFALNGALSGQEPQNPQSIAAIDSITVNESEHALYEIERLRFERWVIANTEKLTDPLLLKEIVRLKKEADAFAEKDDFTLALIWMETIWDLLKPDSSQIGGNELSSDLVNDSAGGLLLEPSSKFRWTKELITGIDVWRQEFQFTFFEGDSSFLDGSGNPYSGVRAAFEYNPNARQSFQTLAFFKYSRDYLSGDLEIRFRNPLGQNSAWRLENRFEGSSFYRDFDLKYLQNRTTFAFDLRRLGPLSIDLKEEFQLRNYADSGSTYPNYYHNTLSGLAKIHTNLGSYFGAGYRNTARGHPDFKANNYFENRFEFSWYQTLGRELNFSIVNDLYFREYPNAPADTIFQDYRENYFRADVKIPFTAILGAEIEGSIASRDYKNLNVNFPDNTLWEIEPRLYLKIGRDWQISAGGYYSELNHQKFPLASTTDAASIMFEDYEMYGPTFTFEFFKINGVMFNIQQSFLWQRYPTSRQRKVTNLAVYSDRQIYSILFFLSWNVSARWRFTALANMDDDRSRQQDSSDSNNTLVGLELNYSF